MNVWVLFKLVLSVSLVSFAGLMVVLGSSAGFPSWLLGIVSGLVFLAALPWVNVQRSSRALGLVGVALGLVVLSLAVSEGLSPERFPLECSSRRRGLFCHFQNVLFDLGGSALAAAPFGLLGLLLLLFGVRLAWKLRRQAGGHSW